MEAVQVVEARQQTMRQDELPQREAVVRLGRVGDRVRLRVRARARPRATVTVRARARVREAAVRPVARGDDAWAEVRARAWRVVRGLHL
jgi:hypothetical protein